MSERVPVCGYGFEYVMLWCVEFDDIYRTACVGGDRIG